MLIVTGSIVIVVPDLFVTLQFEANILPAEVTTSPISIPVSSFTTIELDPVAIGFVVPSTVLSIALYLKSVYDPDNVMAEPATPL